MNASLHANGTFAGNFCSTHSSDAPFESAGTKLPRPLRGAPSGDAALAAFTWQSDPCRLCHGTRLPEAAAEGSGGIPRHAFPLDASGPLVEETSRIRGQALGEGRGGGRIRRKPQKLVAQSNPCGSFSCISKKSETKKNADFPRKRRVRNFFSMINPSSDGILCLQAACGYGRWATGALPPSPLPSAKRGAGLCSRRIGRRLMQSPPREKHVQQQKACV